MKKPDPYAAVKRYRVYSITCHWDERRCDTRAYQVLSFDGYKTDPHCYHHARILAERLEGKGYRRESLT